MRLRKGEIVKNEPLAVSAYAQALGSVPIALLGPLACLVAAVDEMDADQRAHAPQTASWGSVEKALDAVRGVVEAIRSSDALAQPGGPP